MNRVAKFSYDESEHNCRSQQVTWLYSPNKIRHGPVSIAVIVEKIRYGKFTELGNEIGVAGDQEDSGWILSSYSYPDQMLSTVFRNGRNLSIPFQRYEDDKPFVSCIQTFITGERNLFCSNCGKALGAVAHIYNNELLCEDCFLKLGNNQAETSPSTTVLVAKHDDMERAEASSSGNFEPQSANPPSPEAPAATTVQQNANPARLFYPNERILWRRTFSKGIIHRDPTFTEVVSNMRALVVDDTLGSIVRACPLRNAAVVVTNARRDSTRTSMGYGYSGHNGGASMGSSHTIGDVQFLMSGNIILTFHNVSDPHGLKSLVQGAVRSAG